MMNKMLPCLLILFAIGSCSGPGKLSETESRLIKGEVSQMLFDNFKSIKERTYLAELEFLDSSALFFWIPPGQVRPLSYSAVAGIIRKFVPGNRSVENTWDSLHVQPLSKKIASYTGRYQAKYTDTAGRVSQYKMLDMGVAIKRKKGWKIISGQTTPVTPR